MTISNNGQDVSIALDAAGVPHVAYFNTNDLGVYHAELTPSGWTTELIATPLATPTVTSQSTYVSMAAGAVDVLAITWADHATGELRCARRSGTTWSVETVSTAEVSNNDVAVDAQGNVHIAYRDIDVLELHYAFSPVAGNWTISTVDAQVNPGFWVNLAIDAQGGIHMVHWDLGSSLNPTQSIKYLRSIPGGWSRSTVDIVAPAFGASSLSLAVDGSGAPHVAYYESTNDALKYARQVGTAWSVEVVETPTNAGFPSVATDADGSPHLVHWRLNGSLHYRVKRGGTWQAQELRRYGIPSYHGGSIVIDQDGNPFIAATTYTQPPKWLLVYH